MLHLQLKEKLQQKSQQLMLLQRKLKRKSQLDEKSLRHKKKSLRAKLLPNKKTNLR